MRRQERDGGGTGGRNVGDRFRGGDRVGGQTKDHGRGRGRGGNPGGDPEEVLFRDISGGGMEEEISEEKHSSLRCCSTRGCSTRHLSASSSTSSR